MSFWQLTEIYGERNMQRESNYEIMKHRMREVFAQKDLVLAAEKWNLVINAKNIYVRFIARDYAVNVENGIILRTDDGTEADYNEAMTLYDILSREPAPAFKKYVSIVMMWTRSLQVMKAESMDLFADSARSFLCGRHPKCLVRIRIFRLPVTA